MTHRKDRDDINATFHELIAREWPDQRADSAPTRNTADAARSEAPDDAAAEPSLFDWVDPNPDPEPEPEYTLDHVEPDDPGDDWRPSTAPLPSRFYGISPLGALGGLLLVASMLAIGCVVFFQSTRGIASIVAIGGFASGLLILLSRLPRNRPPSDGNGAVV